MKEITNPAAQVLPDSSSVLGKKEQVAQMFNNIAGRYDFLNHFLSMGIDKGWRRKAIKEACSETPATILDVATGTADLAIAAAGKSDATVTGLDIAAQMLDVGRKKIDAAQLSHRITLLEADSEHMPFTGAAFDAVMCAYGVRNFEHLEIGLREMFRVLKPGGKLVILEFSKPTQFPVSQLYRIYFSYMLPVLGRLVSKHSKAYTYLPESVLKFPEGKLFCEILTNCGFSDAVSRPLTFGVTTLYVAHKK